MNEWAKVIIPVVLTGLGAVVWALIVRVDKIQETQVASKEYIYRIKQNELKIKELKNCTKHCN